MVYQRGMVVLRGMSKEDYEWTLEHGWASFLYQELDLVR